MWLRPVPGDSMLMPGVFRVFLVLSRLCMACVARAVPEGVARGPQAEGQQQDSRHGA